MTCDVALQAGNQFHLFQLFFETVLKFSHTLSLLQKIPVSFFLFAGSNRNEDDLDQVTAERMEKSALIFQGEMPRRTSHVLTRRCATKPPYCPSEKNLMSENCSRGRTHLCSQGNSVCDCQL